MTGTKRFKLDSEVGFIDSERCGGDTMTHFEVVVELNKLYEENEQLFNFKENVFNSIDGKIKRGEQAIEWGESVGADVGAMGFHIEMLRMLKKELFE